MVDLNENNSNYSIHKIISTKILHNASTGLSVNRGSGCCVNNCAGGAGSTQAEPQPVEQHFNSRAQSASEEHSRSQFLLSCSSVGQEPGLTCGLQMAT